jgi:putative DNA primase/helicase
VTTAEILGRIPGVKRQESGGWTCFCPGHPDGQKQHRASLRLLEQRTGWRNFKCFAGCEPDNILRAIGLTRADLAPEDGRSRSRVITATFDYTDGAGTLRYQVVRYEPKDFQMRRPDGRGG